MGIHLGWIESAVDSALRQHENRMFGTRMYTEKRQVFYDEKHYRTEARPERYVSSIEKESDVPKPVLNKYYRVEYIVRKSKWVEDVVEENWNHYTGIRTRKVIYTNPL